MATLSTLSRTFNAASVLDAISINVTDTLSDAESRLARLQVDGVTKFAVRKDGRIRYGPDGSNHWSHLVDSTGNLALTGVGSTGGAFSVTPAAGKNVAFNVEDGGYAVVTGNLRLVATNPNPAILAANPSGDANTVLDYDFPEVSTAAATVRFFRLTNTSNITKQVVFYRGNGTATSDNRIGVGTLNCFFCAGGGNNMAIGHSNPQAMLHVIATTEQLRLGYNASNYWTDTIGSSGGRTLAGNGVGGSITITPTPGQDIIFNLEDTFPGVFRVRSSLLTSPNALSPAADEFLIERDGSSGMTIRSASSNIGSIFFGDVENSSAGRIRYNHATDSMNFTTSGNVDTFVIRGGNLIANSLPTSDPAIAGALWNDSGTVKVSSG